MRSRVVRSGTAYIELPESTSDDSDLFRLWARHDEGLLHLCLRVTSLAEGTDRAAAAGCGPVSAVPVEDALGHRVSLHPATNGEAGTGLV